MPTMAPVPSPPPAAPPPVPTPVPTAAAAASATVAKFVCTIAAVAVSPANVALTDSSTAPVASGFTATAA